MNWLNEMLQNDPDPTETREWIDSIQAVIDNEGALRAHQLLEGMVELTRRALSERGIRDYSPYMYKQGMFDRVFGGLKQPLETVWQSFIDGRVERARGLDVPAEFDAFIAASWLRDDMNTLDPSIWRFDGTRLEIEG